MEPKWRSSAAPNDPRAPGTVAPQRRWPSAAAAPHRAMRFACLAGVLFASTAGHAQDELEQIFVTGSRIARPDFDSASPIVSVTEDFFRRSGSRTVESQLNTLPQFVPSYTSTSNGVGNGGQANLDLRGLGTTS